MEDQEDGAVQVDLMIVQVLVLSVLSKVLKNLGLNRKISPETHSPGFGVFI